MQYEHYKYFVRKVVRRKLKNRCKTLSYSGLLFVLRDPVGIRTQDPILKRDVLYQLSY
jgi:hypothetical protein